MWISDSWSRFTQRFPYSNSERSSEQDADEDGGKRLSNPSLEANKIEIPRRRRELRPKRPERYDDPTTPEDASHNRYREPRSLQEILEGPARPGKGLYVANPDSKGDRVGIGPFMTKEILEGIDSDEYFAAAKEPLESSPYHEGNVSPSSSGSPAQSPLVIEYSSQELAQKTKQDNQIARLGAVKDRPEALILNRHAPEENAVARHEENEQFVSTRPRDTITEMLVKVHLLRAMTADAMREHNKTILYSKDASKYAERLAYPPLLARCRYWEGMGRMGERQFDMAVECFKDAKSAEGVYAEGDEAHKMGDIAAWNLQKNPSQHTQLMLPTEQHGLGLDLGNTLDDQVALIEPASPPRSPQSSDGLLQTPDLRFRTPSPSDSGSDSSGTTHTTYEDFSGSSYPQNRASSEETETTEPNASQEERVENTIWGLPLQWLRRTPPTSDLPPTPEITPPTRFPLDDEDEEAVQTTDISVEELQPPSPTRPRGTPVRPEDRPMLSPIDTAKSNDVSLDQITYVATPSRLYALCAISEKPPIADSEDADEDYKEVVNDPHAHAFEDVVDDEAPLDLDEYAELPGAVPTSPSKLYENGAAPGPEEAAEESSDDDWLEGILPSKKNRTRKRRDSDTLGADGDVGDEDGESSGEPERHFGLLEHL